MLELYRRALAYRRAQPALGDGELTWLPTEGAVLGFTRGPQWTLACVVNLSGRPVELPLAGTVVLASGAMDGTLLPPDTAAWVVPG
jgi:alpha-glucosidase